MTKTTTKKLIIFILILLSLCIIILPCNAETVNIDYDSGIISEGFTGPIDGGLNWKPTDQMYLRFSQIDTYKAVKAIIYEFVPGWWNVRDINIHTSEIPIDYYLGGRKISSGIAQFVRHINSEGSLTGGILTLTFDTQLDLLETDVGSKVVTLSGDFLSLNYNGGRPSDNYMPTGTSIRALPDDVPKPYVICLDNRIAYGMGYISGISYRYSKFEHSFSYDYNDEAKTNIYFNLDRMGYASTILMKGESGIALIEETGGFNYEFDILYDIPYILNITNPVYVGTGLFEFYEYTIPDDIVDLGNIIIDWYTYNTEIPSQRVGVNYILNRYNITSDAWELQESGFNPSTIFMTIPNNEYYNLTVSAPGFSNTDFNFYAIQTEHLSIPITPDYGVNFSVSFLVSDYQERRIEGAKIIANGITKYTSFLGGCGFGNIVDHIEYEVSKPGYVTIKGNKTITEDDMLYIFLETEEEAEITPTITPTIPPDITQPTNLLESIQFAFQKMFGLTSSTEDMETANLFMGLGVIFAGAVLIASITKDALGAVVGGLIGFIMSLALGFIPIWVVFVGFSAFAIYIILTKTGGTA